MTKRHYTPSPLAPSSRPRLTMILNSLIAKSELSGHGETVMLDGGLSIEIWLGDHGFRLSIYRPYEYPSDIEWSTVLKYLPEPYKPAAAAADPIRLPFGGFYTLARTWPAPPKLL